MILRYRDCEAAFPRRKYVEKKVLERLSEWVEEINERAAAVTARKAAWVSAEVDAERLQRALVDNAAALRRLVPQKAIDGDRMPTGIYDDAREEFSRLVRRSRTS